jgi:hypothetical protein
MQRNNLLLIKPKDALFFVNRRQEFIHRYINALVKLNIYDVCVKTISLVNNYENKHFLPITAVKQRENLNE